MHTRIDQSEGQSTKISQKIWQSIDSNYDPKKIFIVPDQTSLERQDDQALCCQLKSRCEADAHMEYAQSLYSKYALLSTTIEDEDPDIIAITKTWLELNYNCHNPNANRSVHISLFSVFHVCFQYRDTQVWLPQNCVVDNNFPLAVCSLNWPP